MDSEPTTRWKWRFITLWHDYQNRNQPTNFAEQALIVIRVNRREELGFAAVGRFWSTGRHHFFPRMPQAVTDIVP
jgi:hypothetical protein